MNSYCWITERKYYLLDNLRVGKHSWKTQRPLKRLYPFWKKKRKRNSKNIIKLKCLVSEHWNQFRKCLKLNGFNCGTLAFNRMAVMTWKYFEFVFLLSKVKLSPGTLVQFSISWGRFSQVICVYFYLIFALILHYMYKFLPVWLLICCFHSLLSVWSLMRSTCFCCDFWCL